MGVTEGLALAASIPIPALPFPEQGPGARLLALCLSFLLHSKPYPGTWEEKNALIGVTDFDQALSAG